jgi:hypothetical protein
MSESKFFRVLSAMDGSEESMRAAAINSSNLIIIIIKIILLHALHFLLYRSFSLPNDLNNIPLKTKIAASKEPTIALSTGIDVNKDIKVNEIAAAARLMGNQILIAADELINLILMILIYYPNLLLTASQR